MEWVWLTVMLAVSRSNSELLTVNVPFKVRFAPVFVVSMIAVPVFPATTTIFELHTEFVPLIETIALFEPLVSPTKTVFPPTVATPPGAPGATTPAAGTAAPKK